MNSINRINQINQQELDANVSDSASWHNDYKDSNYIFIGGLNAQLKEKDLIVIFSQYGLPTHIKLVKDSEKKENKGFGYLKYQQFQSCVLAVDNLNGVVVYDKKIRVDHCWFELRDDETEDSYWIDYDALVPKLPAIEYDKTEAKVKEVAIENNEGEDEDEFKDPMAQFLKKRSHDQDHKHKKRHRSDKSHRHSHHNRGNKPDDINE
ncbi:RNA-binding protein Cwf29 [Yamadazyma tenuis]|nr:RNA-binding protein Cwf29 [Yamadazyma tenuis]